MGVKPTLPNFKSLTFDGENSRDYGVYISGEAVFNAPTRAVEMITIPGRNGSYALDKGNFENIEVRYPAGMFADNLEDFANGISDFRNFLCSRNGYVRLTDDYNPDEYRLAVYKSGLEVTPMELIAGEFEIVFDAKPQRYLAIGEELVEIGAWGNTEEASGSIATFEAQSDTAIKSLVVDINPVQSGSGDPSPDNIRPISGWGSVESVVCGKNFVDSSNATSGLCGYHSGDTINTVVASTRYSHSKPIPAEQGLAVSCRTNNLNTFNQVLIECFDNSGKWVRELSVSSFEDTTNSKTRTVPSNTYKWVRLVYCSLSGYQVGTNIDGDVMCALGETVMPYTAYNGTTHTTSLGTTVYGGTVDVVSGTLKTYPYYASYNGETLTGEWISDRDKYVAGTTPTTGAQVVNIGGTPTTSTVTGQTVTPILGTNHIFADSGDVTVEYGHNPTMLTNPTYFDARPMLQVWGYGDINLSSNQGTRTVSINSTNIGDVIISGKKVAPTITLDLSTLNTGDTFYVNMSRYRKYTCTDISATHIISSSITSNTNCQTIRTTHSDEFLLEINPMDNYVNGKAVAEFVKGTSRTLTSTVVFTLTVDNNGTETTTSVTAQCSTVYDGSNTITLSSTWSPSSVTGLSITYNQTIYNEVTGYSTMSALGTPIYIDLDIGEAYKMENGSTVSVNNAVQIPAELPTLPSGNTTVTHDNTVTKLEVEPRWWKV